MSSSKGQPSGQSGKAAAAATMAKVTQPVTESNKKNGAAATETKKPLAGKPAAAAGKIEVPKYKRSDGTPVSEHVRRPPGQAEAEKKEQSKREREEKKAAKSKAFFESKGKTKPAAKDEGDWEEQEDENELGDGEGQQQEEEQEQEEEDEESKRAKTDQEDGEDGEGEGQEHQQGQEAEAGASAQKPKMSMDEFLSMPWAHQQAVLIDKKLEQSKDSVAHTLVVKDAINAAKKMGSAAFTDAAMSRNGGGTTGPNGEGSGTGEMGYKEFLAAFDKAGHHNSGDRASVSRHLRSGKYHDGAEMGKTCLVPHLYGAGMFELAKEVQSGKYKF